MSPQKLFILGPEGTYSDAAARHFDAQGRCQRQFSASILEVAGNVVADPSSIGVLPIENSTTGVVGLCQEALLLHDLLIRGELHLPITFSLLYRGANPKQIRFLHAHQQAYDQCSKFIAECLPQHQFIPTDSNIHAVKDCLRSTTAHTAALGPCAYLHQASLGDLGWQQIPGVQNYEHNYTRFILCSRATPQCRAALDYQNTQKTSIIVHLKRDKHSMLYPVLERFHRYRINLSALHSRPIPQQTDRMRWEYVFFIDFDNTSGQSAACLEELQQDPGLDITVLGAYDSALL